jgi:hypothetical protein
MANDTIRFRVQWAEETRASLAYLIDNGSIILHPNAVDDARSGRGVLEIVYEAPQAPIHQLQWMLWFPGEELTELLAEAKRETSTKFAPLNAAEKAVQRWETSGAL